MGAGSEGGSASSTQRPLNACCPAAHAAAALAMVGFEPGFTAATLVPAFTHCPASTRSPFLHFGGGLGAAGLSAITGSGVGAVGRLGAGTGTMTGAAAFTPFASGMTSIWRSAPQPSGGALSTMVARVHEASSPSCWMVSRVALLFAPPPTAGTTVETPPLTSASLPAENMKEPTVSAAITWVASEHSPSRSSR